MSFSENLIHLRNHNNLTQEQVADSLGVTRQAVSKWEAGQCMPDVEKLIQLADLFQITTDELINGLKFRPKRKENNAHLYPVLIFIFLLTMWISGFVMVLCTLCFDLTSQGIYFGKELMTNATVLFGIMVGFHGLCKLIDLLKKRKENQNN